MARAYGMLARRADFARVTRRGARRSSPHLTCFVLDGRGASAVGVTVAASVGNAVVRNRLRRRLKAVFDGYPLGVPPWREIVVIARPGAGELSFQRLREEVRRALPA